jgi:flagellar L-ring protein precursor FlgH
MYLRLTSLLLIASAGMLLHAAKKPKKADEPTPFDRYIQETLGRSRNSGSAAAPGSLWSPDSRLTDLAGDLRAAHVDDLITIVVAESASAVAQGSSKTQRQSNVNASVGALAGIPSPKGALTNLANASSQSQLNGEGATSRSSQLSTTLSARVTHVLPNGYFAVEGMKDVVVNSEHQLVVVRGIVRPSDLTADNLVASNRIGQMEITIKGKGVVGDAIRRPFILYRILMGLLPF